MYPSYPQSSSDTWDCPGAVWLYLEKLTCVPSIVVAAGGCSPPSSSLSPSPCFSHCQGLCTRLPPLVATYCCGLTRKGAPCNLLSVWLCAFIASIQITGPAFFSFFFLLVTVNNHLICFPVSLPLKANFTYWDPFPCFFIFKLYSITIIIALLPFPFQFSSSQ